jgi:mannose-1-phosphate guanylyltransferase
MDHLYAVVIAGGAGTRFWPASRRLMPKQLLPLGADPTEPLLAATVRRIAPLCPPERVLIATGAHLVEATRAALPGFPSGNILAEPTARNTAPCIAWAARHVERRDPEATVMVFPADHAVTDEASFRETILEAVALARGGAIATIGLEPTRAETGYGYIEVGDALGGRSHRVARFVEKPDLPRAEGFLAGGRHLWNGGMFFFQASRLEAEVRAHLPALGAGLDRIDQAAADDASRGTLAAGAEASALAVEFPLLPSISIDHGIMEKAADLAVVRGNFGWSDVGSWQTAYELSSHDAAGNAAPEDAVLIDATGNLVRDLRSGAPADRARRVLALVGVSDLVVIETDDALLVMPRARAQDAKLVVEALSRRGSGAV